MNKTTKSNPMEDQPAHPPPNWPKIRISDFVYNTKEILQSNHPPARKSMSLRNHMQYLSSNHLHPKARGVMHLNTIESSLFSQRESVINAKINHMNYSQNDSSLNTHFNSQVNQRETGKGKMDESDMLNFNIYDSIKSGEHKAQRSTGDGNFVGNNRVEEREKRNETEASEQKGSGHLARMLFEQKKNSELLHDAICKLNESISKSFNNPVKNPNPQKEPGPKSFNPVASINNKTGSIEIQMIPEIYNKNGRQSNYKIQHVFEMYKNPKTVKLEKPKESSKLIMLGELPTKKEEETSRERINLRQKLNKKRESKPKHISRIIPGKFGGFPKNIKKGSVDSSDMIKFSNISQHPLIKRVTFDSSIENSMFKFIKKEPLNMELIRENGFSANQMQTNSIFRNIELDDDDLMKSEENEMFEWDTLKKNEKNLFTVSNEHNGVNQSVEEDMMGFSPENRRKTRSTRKSLFGVGNNANDTGQDTVIVKKRKSSVNSIRSRKRTSQNTKLSLKMKEINILKKFLKRIEGDAKMINGANEGSQKPKKRESSAAKECVRRNLKQHDLVLQFDQINQRLQNIEKDTRELTRDKNKNNDKLKKIIKENEKLKIENNHLKGMTKVYKEINCPKPLNENIFDFDKFKYQLRQNLFGKNLQITVEDNAGMNTQAGQGGKISDWKHFLVKKRNNIKSLQTKRINITREMQTDEEKKREVRRSWERSPVRSNQRQTEQSRAKNVDLNLLSLFNGKKMKKKNFLSMTKNRKIKCGKQRKKEQNCRARGRRKPEQKTLYINKETQTDKKSDKSKKNEIKRIRYTREKSPWNEQDEVNSLKASRSNSNYIKKNNSDYFSRRDVLESVNKQKKRRNEKGRRINCNLNLRQRASKYRKSEPKKPKKTSYKNLPVYYIGRSVLKPSKTNQQANSSIFQNTNDQQHTISYNTQNNKFLDCLKNQESFTQIKSPKIFNKNKLKFILFKDGAEKGKYSKKHAKQKIRKHNLKNIFKSTKEENIGPSFSSLKGYKEPSITSINPESRGRINNSKKNQNQFYFTLGKMNSNISPSLNNHKECNKENENDLSKESGGASFVLENSYIKMQ